MGQGQQSAAHHRSPSPSLEVELDQTRRRAAELDRKLQLKSYEADLLRRFAIQIREQRHEALLREELAQGMMIGAEKRLRDKEAEHTQVLMWSRQMMEDHAKEVALLKGGIQAEAERVNGMVEERTRLVTTVKEIKSQIEDGYMCDM